MGWRFAKSAAVVTAEETKRLIDAEGARSLVVQTNVSDSESVKKMVQEVLSRISRLGDRASMHAAAKGLTLSKAAFSQGSACVGGLEDPTWSRGSYAYWQISSRV